MHKHEVEGEGVDVAWWGDLHVRPEDHCFFCNGVRLYGEALEERQPDEYGKTVWYHCIACVMPPLRHLVPRYKH